jgi:hypothetical protein
MRGVRTSANAKRGESELKTRRMIPDTAPATTIAGVASTWELPAQR